MNRPGTRRAQIHRVRITTADTIQEVRPFSADTCYIITDKYPYLEFEVEGAPLIAPKSDHKTPTFEPLAESAGIFWQKWQLGPQLSQDRRMGRFELTLQFPADITLQCYVVPAKLLGVADLWAMSEDVERELDRPAAWDPNPTSRVRSYVQEGGAQVSTTVSLLATVRQELASARSLRRDPPREPSRRGRALVSVPEVALVSQWAVRRSAVLAQAEKWMTNQHTELRRRRAEHGPQKRIDTNVNALAVCESQLEELRALLPQLMHIIDRNELVAPLSFGPIVQRDHRLRNLLGAFAPPTSEVVSEQVSPWSRYPPVSLNDLFERWGAVWIVQQLRALGFAGQANLALGADKLESCTWTLWRGEIEVLVDFEPAPALLSFDELPSLDERELPAVEWAVLRQFVDPERPLFGSERCCSPDYVLRIRGPGGAAMAIGDACLADPAHHHEKEAKAHVVSNYRRSMLWRTDDRLVRCDPHGAFVLLPGPPEGWANLESKTRALDVWHFCPRPRGADALAHERFTRFIERLLRCVI